MVGLLSPRTVWATKLSPVYLKQTKVRFMLAVEVHIHIPLIPVLRMQRNVDYFEFGTSEFQASHG